MQLFFLAPLKVLCRHLASAVATEDFVFSGSNTRTCTRQPCWPNPAPSKGWHFALSFLLTPLLYLCLLGDFVYKALRLESPTVPATVSSVVSLPLHSLSLAPQSLV